MKATHRLIDSVWTVEYNIIDDESVEIIRFSRKDPEGYDKERSLPQCTVIEDDKRTFIGLLVRDTYKPFDWVNKNDCDHHYTVINPKHVFDYNS